MKTFTGLFVFLTMLIAPLASANPMSGIYQSIQGTGRTVTISRDYTHTYARYMNYNTSVLYFMNGEGSFYSGSWNFRIRMTSATCFTLNWGSTVSDQLCLQSDSGNLLREGLYYSIRGTDQFVKIYRHARSGLTYAGYLDYQPSLLTFQNNIGSFSSGPLLFTLRLTSPSCFLLMWGASGCDELCFSY